MDKGEMSVVRVCRLQCGGYVAGKLNEDLFASQSISEVLQFVRDMIEPVGGPLAPDMTITTIRNRTE